MLFVLMLIKFVVYTSLSDVYDYIHPYVVNIGIWWYKWGQESLHLLQIGFYSCGSCDWPHHRPKDALMVWNDSTRAFAGGMFHSYVGCWISSAWSCNRRMAKEYHCKRTWICESWTLYWQPETTFNCRIYYHSWMVAPRIITSLCLINVQEKALWLLPRKFKVYQAFLLFSAGHYLILLTQYESGTSFNWWWFSKNISWYSFHVWTSLLNCFLLPLVFSAT